MHAARWTTLLVSLLFFSLGSSAQQAAPPERYEVRRIHDPNGIGKFYMGREIAQVMGLEGAGLAPVQKETLPPLPGRVRQGRAPRRGPSAVLDTMTPHAKNELLVVINKSDALFVKEFASFSAGDNDSVCAYSAPRSSRRTALPLSLDWFAAKTTASVRTASG